MAMSSESLNVIGLISGGKDSFFSLLHCLANNHRVIALANLYPPAVSSPEDDVEDENSFMYQTAGHAVIPLYSEALGLPLYRQEILGLALNQSKDYHATPGGTPSGASGRLKVYCLCWRQSRLLIQWQTLYARAPSSPPTNELGLSL